MIRHFAPNIFLLLLIATAAVAAVFFRKKITFGHYGQWRANVCMLILSGLWGSGLVRFYLLAHDPAVPTWAKWVMIPFGLLWQTAFLIGATVALNSSFYEAEDGELDIKETSLLATLLYSYLGLDEHRTSSICQLSWLAAFSLVKMSVLLVLYGGLVFLLGIIVACTCAITWQNPRLVWNDITQAESATERASARFTLWQGIPVSPVLWLLAWSVLHEGCHLSMGASLSTLLPVAGVLWLINRPRTQRHQAQRPSRRNRSPFLRRACPLVRGPGAYEGK